MRQDFVRIGKAELSAFTSAIFAAAGVSRAHADEWANMLIWANLRGVDSHGVIRIPRYLYLLRRKSINAAPNMRVERKDGAVVILEADRAPGAVAMTRAMHEAIETAREVHIGWCGARNITHSGAIGYFALQAAEAGMAGIVMSASGPMMAVQHHESDYLLKRTIDQFDRLYAEGQQRAKILALAIHPYLSVQPHRIKYLEQIYDYASRFDGVLYWNGIEILDWYRTAAGNRLGAAA